MSPSEWSRAGALLHASHRADAATGNAVRLAHRSEEHLASRPMAIPAHGHQEEGQVKLKPCPFCGPAGVLKAPKDMDGVKHGYKSVECETCWAIGPQMMTAAVAIERWNRRTKPRRDTP